MAKQTINLGTGELTGDGESIRSAFDKINDNFDELYAQDSNDVVLSAINGHIIPDTDVTYDLGSASKRFRDLYLSGSTIDLGGTTLSIVGGNLQIGGTDIKDVVTAAGVDYTEIQNTPDLSNYVTQAQLAAGSITVDVNNTGDLTGSVFADDSTLLVDGVNGKIVAPIDINDNEIFDGAGDTGLNIRSNQTDGNIYLYSYGSDGDGTGAGNIYVKSDAVEIYSDWQNGGVGEKKWTFGSNGSLTFPDATVQTTAWTGTASGFTYSELGGTSEIGVTADVFDFGDGKTIDMQNSTVLFTGSTVSGILSLNTDYITIGVGGSINMQGSDIGAAGTVSAASVSTLDLTTNTVRSEGDITIDINLSDSTLRTWKFTEGGQFETAGSVIVNGGVRFPGVGTISGDDAVPSLDLEVVEGGDITLLSGNHAWKFNSDGTLKTPELVVGPAGTEAPKLYTTVNEQNGVAMDLRIQSGDAGSVTGNIYITAPVSDEFGIRGKVFVENRLNVPVIETGNIQPEEGGVFIGVPTDNALQIMAGHTINEFSSINSSLFWSWDNDVADFTFSVPGEVKVQDTGGSDLSTRYTTEFIEFQGASQLSVPLDGWRSQFAVDIVNKVMVVSTAETGSGQDVLVIQPGSVTFTTDFYFIDPNDSGTYYQVTGVTDLGGGFTQLDIPGFDFTSLIGPVPVELFDSATNDTAHEIRIDSSGDATGIRSLTGVTSVTGEGNQYLYLSTAITGGATSSNIAMTSVGGVKNTLNGTTDFGSGATVNFANATVTNWSDPNVVNTHTESSVWITVGISEATIDNLTVRIANDGSNNMEVQFNYDPTATVDVSASGDSDNRFGGFTTLAPGNTTWTTLNSITTVGTTRTFTVTDHGFHKVYRGTVISHAMPDGGSTPGDAYCILERLL